MGPGNNNAVNGLFEQDDMDNWRGVTQASLSPIARQYAHELSMPNLYLLSGNTR